MKCRILHRTSDRLRVHVYKYYMTPGQADKLEAHLKNGEKVVISRQYVHSLKVKLGIEEVE